MGTSDIIDMATGIAGGLLLVSTIFLFAFLPQDEPVPPTFRATYVATETTVELNLDEAFAEGETRRFPLDIESNTVHRIEWVVQWEDDVPSSLPDQWQFNVIGTDNERQGSPRTVANDEPNVSQSDAASGNATTTYTATPKLYKVTAPLQAPPRNGPVPAAHIEEDAANAKSRLTEALVTLPAGEWNLEAFLDIAGDCPPAGNDPQRSSQCTDDNSNNLLILSVTYTTYDVEVEEIVPL